MKWIPPCGTHPHSDEVLWGTDLQHIKHNIPASLDSFQFAFKTNRPTEDTISTALHSLFTQDITTPTPECCLWISAQHSTQSPPWNWFSTLGLSTTLCNWILDLLTNRPQTVQIVGHTSSTLVLNTGAPQGCVLSPLLTTAVLDMESLRMTPPSLAGLQTMMRLHIGRKSTILLSGTQRTTYCSMSAESRSW